MGREQQAGEAGPGAALDAPELHLLTAGVRTRSLAASAGNPNPDQRYQPGTGHTALSVCVPDVGTLAQRHKLCLELSSRTVGPSGPAGWAQLCHMKTSS